MTTEQDITTVLANGDPVAASRLMPLVYNELRALAQSVLARRGAGHTLQATAIVNEAYLKLAGSANPTWQGRAHFFAVAAKALRQVLTDHARKKNTKKRGGDAARITLSELAESPSQPGLDLIALDEALEKLTEIDPRQAQVVELRFLAGLNVEETAHVMGIAPRTVEREWLVAKAWLRREMSVSEP